MPIVKPQTVLGLHFFKYGWVDDLKRDQTQNYKDFTRRKNTAVDNSQTAVCCYILLSLPSFTTSIFTQLFLLQRYQKRYMPLWLSENSVGNLQTFKIHFLVDGISQTHFGLFPLTTWSYLEGERKSCQVDLSPLQFFPLFKHIHKTEKREVTGCRKGTAGEGYHILASHDILSLAQKPQDFFFPLRMATSYEVDPHFQWGVETKGALLLTSGLSTTFFLLQPVFPIRSPNQQTGNQPLI